MLKPLLTHEMGSLAKPGWRVKAYAGKPLDQRDLQDAGSWGRRLGVPDHEALVALLERDAKYSIDTVRPTVLVLPAPSYNQDHEALFKAGFTACRPHRREDKPFIDLVVSCDAVQLGWGDAAFHPDFYVDISDYLGAKLDALAFHKSQLRPPPDPGSLENVERLARLRGAEIAVEAAEAFECHRVVL